MQIDFFLKKKLKKISYGKNYLQGGKGGAE